LRVAKKAGGLALLTIAYPPVMPCLDANIAYRDSSGALEEAVSL
jgi:hypothetical protein